MTLSKNNTDAIDPDELGVAMGVLEKLLQEPELCLAPGAPYAKLAQQAALLHRRLKSARKREERLRDQELSERSMIREKRTDKERGTYLSEDVPSSMQDVSLSKQRKCYICKAAYQQLDSFYDALCPECAQFNFSKRLQTAELNGRTALVTGGRIKIGFQIALKLLRAGAHVIVTSRFPLDTADRYAREEDYLDWSERLSIYSADFRFLPAVIQMAEQIQSQFDSLDILINNASQTVRRPPEYYRHLIQGELELGQQLTDSVLRTIKTSATDSTILDASAPKVLGAPQAEVQRSNATPAATHPHISALMSQFRLLSEDGKHAQELFPMGELDFDGQQIDKRKLNSWIMELTEVPLPELLEVQAVNSLSAFILIQQFKPLLMASSNQERFIVNVSAVEGQFDVTSKTGFHPHTNMAKAAMNMVTKTCGDRFAREQIYMTSVDTGWVTNEFPFEKTQGMKSEGFEPPLDEIDGAARVCDPIFHGLNERQFQYGIFLKDYRPTNW